MTNMSENNEIFICPPETEEEIPDYAMDYNKNELKFMELEIKERDKERKDKKYFSAFRLIIGCMIMLGIIYLIDVISNGILNKSVSTITDSIIEIIKTMIFTLSGYLFAKKDSDN
jgi:hypothetical protein